MRVGWGQTGRVRAGWGQTGRVRAGWGQMGVVRMGIAVALAGEDVHVVGGFGGRGCSSAMLLARLRGAWRASAVRHRGASPLLLVLRSGAAVVVVPRELSPSPPPRPAHPRVVGPAAALRVLVGAVVIPGANARVRVGGGRVLPTHGRGWGPDREPGVGAATGVGVARGRRGGGGGAPSSPGPGVPYRGPRPGLPAVGGGGRGAGRRTLAGVRGPLPHVAVGVGQDVGGAQAAVHQAVLQSLLLARLGRALRTAKSNTVLTLRWGRASRPAVPQTRGQTER